MATLGFLDPPKAVDQAQRERRHEVDPTSARSSRVVRLVLWMVGIASLAAVALIVFTVTSMITSKQAWLSKLRAEYAVESLTLVDGSGRSGAVDCWTGTTVNLIASLKNQKVEIPASMQNRSLTWTVVATGSGDEPPNRGTASITTKPCGEIV